MKRLEPKEIADLCEDRPALAAELGKVEAVWQMPPSTGSVRMMEKALLLLARYKPDRLGSFYKAILSTPGTGKDKDGNRKPDNVTTWLFDPAALPMQEAPAPGGRPVKYGDEAKARARALREEGFSIRNIAKEMQASTFTIQRLLKD